MHEKFLDTGMTRPEPETDEKPDGNTMAFSRHWHITEWRENVPVLPWQRLMAVNDQKPEKTTLDFCILLDPKLISYMTQLPTFSGVNDILCKKYYHIKFKILNCLVYIEKETPCRGRQGE